MFASYCFLLYFNQETLNKFKNILKHITGTTRLKLNKSDLENITIWLPQIDEMNILIEEMQKIDFNRSQINIKLESSQSLQKSLINQVF